VPLSDHEQRMLEQMERALYAEDPKFATALEGSELRTYTRKRVYQAIAGFLLGITLLMVGLPVGQEWLSIVGFLIMLGCAAIGFTIYPGSDAMYDQYEEIRELSAEAKSYGIPTVLWSYPRGGNVTKEGELAVDIIAYAAHMAALLGAHIIKVKLPNDYLENAEAKKVYLERQIPIGTLPERVRHIMQSCFNGRRIVVFSGGAHKDENAIFDDARAIRDGGGNGSIIGRNSFQRSREDALVLLDRLVKIYLGKE